MKVYLLYYKYTLIGASKDMIVKESNDQVGEEATRQANDQCSRDTIRRVNVDFPAWVVEGLDKQARHLGVTRQSLIKMWIAERLK